MDKIVRLGVWKIHVYQCKDGRWRYGVDHHLHRSFRDPRFLDHYEKGGIGAESVAGAFHNAIVHLNEARQDKARLDKQLSFYALYEV